MEEEVDARTDSQAIRVTDRVQENRASRLFLIDVAVLLQLSVPMVLIFDLLWANTWGLADKLVLGGALVWLVTGLTVLELVRRRVLSRQRLIGPVVAIYAGLIGIALMEVTARAVFRPQELPMIYPTGRIWVQDHDPRITPGIEGPSTFSANSLGLRGPEPPGGDAYRIIAMGGSTTICTDLDDGEVWTHLLMQDLNSREAMPRVWVGNAGVDGHTTVHHLELMRALPQLREADMLLFLIGLNDLAVTLSADGEATDQILRRSAAHYVDRWVHRQGEPMFRKMRIAQAARAVAWPLVSRIETRRKTDQRFYTRMRELRNSVPKVPMPDLEKGIEEYRRRIKALADECLKLDITCIFLTQPSMWRSSMTPEEESLLWGACVGPFGNITGCLSSGDAALAMDVFNQTLMGLCYDRSLECLDLAGAIPKNQTAFFDGAHFNVNGSKLVASYLSSQLSVRLSDSYENAAGTEAD